MTVSLTQLQEWMDTGENEHIEFKEANNQYSWDRLIEYCVALANEGGGYLILGVTDRRPRRVVGSQAFQNLNQVKHNLLERLRIRIEADVLNHPDGRVVVFSIPSRPIGTPLHCNGTYMMRSGESLVPMTQDQLRRIFDEDVQDFSALICRGATINDLDERAICELRERWIRKSSNASLQNKSNEQLLIDAELINNGEITYAALILLGKSESLNRYLTQSEVILEYRSTEAAGPAQQREEYRQGYFLFLDEIWKTINLRNDLQHFYLDMTAYDVPTFDEKAVREAVLNAVSHRDYREPASIFVRQYPRRLEVESPGGLPGQITPHNILTRQLPRNRRIAEVLVKCGLVERAGQGFNLIYEQEIKQGKPLPELTGTDEHRVFLTLHGKIEDTQFLRFLERLGEERVNSFTTEDLLALYQINKNYLVDEELKPRLPKLLQEDLVISIAGGKQTRFVLSPQFYEYTDKRLSGNFKQVIERGVQKTTLLTHIIENELSGSKLDELMALLPSLTRRQIQEILREMKEEGTIYSAGKGAGGRWYPERQEQP